MLRKLVLGIISLCFMTLALAETPTSRYLFVIHATRGKVTQPDLNQNAYQLVLHKVAGMYFSDRPVRDSGILNLSQFFEKWDKGNDSFKANNPNAALVTVLDFKKDKQQITELVVLSDPIYNAKKNDVTFSVKSINGKTKLLPGALNNATLVVDDGFWP